MSTDTHESSPVQKAAQMNLEKSFFMTYEIQRTPIRSLFKRLCQSFGSAIFSDHKMS